MKKISVLSVIAVLVMPAMAVENVQTMYGKEPVDVVPEEVAAQYEKQFKTDDANKVEKVQENTGNKQEEVVEEKVEKVKKVKKVQKVEEVEEVEKVPENKYEEPKYEEPSNPKARFPHGLQLGVGISPTSGLNGFVGYNNKNFNSFWAKRFGVRFDFAGYSPVKHYLNKRINEEFKDDGFKIDDTLKIDNFQLNAKHFGALVDFYPFGDTWFLGGLRVSGGYFTGKLDLDADIHGTYNGSRIEFELDGKKYSYDGSTMNAKAMVDWKYDGPYLGAGFDLGLFWGFKVYMDAGVVFTGNTAKLDLYVPFQGLKDEHGVDIIPDSGNPLVQAAYDEFYNAKEKTLADARKEVKDYPYYPLVKLGLMYRF